MNDESHELYLRAYTQQVDKKQPRHHVEMANRNGQSMHSY